MVTLLLWLFTLSSIIGVKMILTFIVPFIKQLKTLSLIPGPPSNWLGRTDCLVDTNNNVLRFKRWAQTFGDVFQFRVLNQHIVVISCPEFASKVLSRELALNKPANYMVATEITSPIGTRNVLTLQTDDPAWKLARKAIAPAFATKNARAAFQVVMEVSNVLVDVLKRQADGVKHYDMVRLLTQETLDVIAKWGFRQDLNTLTTPNSKIVPEGVDLVEALAETSKETLRRYYNPLRKHAFWTKEQQELNKAYEALYHTWSALLKQYRCTFDPNDLADQSIAAHLLRVRDADGRGLSDAMLQSHFGIMFFGGHDTTANTLSYALYQLSQNPAVLQRLEQELASKSLLVTKDNPKPASMKFDDLQDLPYLQAVVKETHRLMPVAPWAGRVSSKDLKLGDYTIPAGEAFVPERWLPFESEGGAKTNSTVLQPIDVNKTAAAPHTGTLPAIEARKVSPAPYMPFVEGPRDCVGRNLAAVTVPATLAQLVRHFRFQLAEPFDHDSLWHVGITMRPGAGLPMCVTPRGLP